MRKSTINLFLNTLYAEIEAEVCSVYRVNADENFINEKVDEEFKNLAKYLVEQYKNRWDGS